MSAIYRNLTIMAIKNFKMYKRIFITQILPLIEYVAEYGVEKQCCNWSPFSSSIILSQILKDDMSQFSLRLRKFILIQRFRLKVINFYDGDF